MHYFGTLPAWLTVALVVGAAWSFRRGGGSTAISSLEIANRVLEKRVHDLEEAGRLKDRELAELRGRTDVALALAPLIEWSSQHEQRAAERHVATLNVLDLIARRLGPEPAHEAAA
jgi:hypothetical protein